MGHSKFSQFAPSEQSKQQINEIEKFNKTLKSSDVMPAFHISDNIWEINLIWSILHSHSCYRHHPLHKKVTATSLSLCCQMFQDYVRRWIQLFVIFFTLSRPSGNHFCTFPSKIVENMAHKSWAGYRSTNFFLENENLDNFLKIIIIIHRRIHF